jgi:hypothetical protein
MRNDQVYAFDWNFLKPLINRLDTIGVEYYISHSHYIHNHTTPDNLHHTTLRIYGPEEIINTLDDFEREAGGDLEYQRFDKDNEIQNGQKTISGLARDFGVAEHEMLDVFKVWDQTSRLKARLLELWLEGSGNSWNLGVHYALNSLGLMHEALRTMSTTSNLTYYEEKEYIRRNLPNRE